MNTMASPAQLPAAMPMARFIRDYAAVLDAAEQTEAEVVLERRGGRSSFVIAPLGRVEADRHAVSALTHILRRALGNKPAEQLIAAGVVDEFPWVGFLPTAERKRFETELLEVLRGCASLGRFTAFEHLVESWQASAEIWSDPALARSLQAPITVPPGGDVPAPDAG